MAADIRIPNVVRGAWRGSRRAGVSGGTISRDSGDGDGHHRSSHGDQYERAPPPEPLDEERCNRGTDDQGACPRHLEDADDSAAVFKRHALAEPGVTGDRGKCTASHDEDERHREGDDGAAERNDAGTADQHHRENQDRLFTAPVEVAANEQAAEPGHLTETDDQGEGRGGRLERVGEHKQKEVPSAPVLATDLLAVNRENTPRPTGIG